MAAKKKNKPKKFRPPFSLWRFLLKWLVVCCVIGGLILSVIILYYSLDLPSTSKLLENNRIPGIKVVTESGDLVANYGETYGAVLEYKDFSPYLIQAVIATEDRRFFEHFGVDLIGMFRAAYVNFEAHRVVQGGSTITQQLAKNVFFNPERTMKRKIQEMILAIWLEHKYSKEQIITMYLNRIYLGGGNFGADAAARNFFGKSASELSLSESAIIAGLIRAPSRYSPTSNPELSAQRAKQVLINMEDAGYISAAKALEAEKDLKKENPISTANMYFAAWVAEQLPEYIGKPSTDIIVKTTLDLKLQKKAEEALKKALDENGEKLKISQGALVSLSNDGKILAMIGGKNYKSSPFNRAVQAQRQPGSSFKLFVYITAFEHGFSPDSIMVDKPIDINGWAPENYEEKFFGEITLKEAFAKSLNGIAAQLGQQVGIENIISTAERLGIKSKMMAIPSAALGTNEVNLLELTGAYATVANNGFKVEPYGIEEIDDSDGNVLYKREEKPQDLVLDQTVLLKINSVLSEVINSGTGTAAKLDRPAAGKTGTSQDYRDAWFIGFTPQITTGVWVGNDDNTSMKKVTGGKISAPIWKDFMETAMEGLPVMDIPIYTGNFLQQMMVPAQEPAKPITQPAAPQPKSKERSFWDRMFWR